SSRARRRGSFLSAVMAAWTFITFTSAGGSDGDARRQGLVAVDKARIDPLRLADHLDIVEAFQDLFPDDLQLQFGEPQAHATVDAEAEGDVGARARAVNDELVGTFDSFFVAAARDVPHHALVALFDLLAGDVA